MYIVTQVKLSFRKYCLAEKYLSIRALNMKNELWKVPGFFATSCCCFSVQVSERWPSESKKLYQYCSKEVIMLACFSGIKVKSKSQVHSLHRSVKIQTFLIQLLVLFSDSNYFRHCGPTYPSNLASFGLTWLCSLQK